MSRRRAGPKKKSGSVLLSHTVSHAVPSALEGLTTVFGMGTGVAPRHCHRTKIDNRSCDLEIQSRQTPNESTGKKTGQASRPISTARLNALLHLHLRPINLVVSKEPLGILRSREISS